MIVDFGRSRMPDGEVPGDGDGESRLNTLLRHRGPLCAGALMLCGCVKLSSYCLLFRRMSAHSSAATKGVKKLAECQRTKDVW